MVSTGNYPNIAELFRLVKYHNFIVPRLKRGYKPVITVAGKGYSYNCSWLIIISINVSKAIVTIRSLYIYIFPSYPIIPTSMLVKQKEPPSPNLHFLRGGSNHQSIWVVYDIHIRCH